MFLDAEIQKRFPIHEKVRWYVVALAWIAVDIAILYCGYRAYFFEPRIMPLEVQFSWYMVFKPVIFLAIFIGVAYLFMRSHMQRKHAAQCHYKQHEKHLIKMGLKDIMWTGICFALVFSFLDTGWVPVFYVMGMNTYDGIYAWLKIAIPVLLYVIFFNGLLYYYIRKIGLSGAYFMLCLLLVMVGRGDLSLQTFGDPSHYFGEWANFIDAIYILAYIIPFLISSFMGMAKDLKSPYFQIRDLDVVKNSGASMAFNDINTVSVIDWFALLGIYGVKFVSCTGCQLRLFWFGKDTAHALKDYLQERARLVHAK